MIRPKEVLITLCRVLSLLLLVSAIFMVFSFLIVRVPMMFLEKQGGGVGVSWMTSGGYGFIPLVFGLILNFKAELFAEWIMDHASQETESGNEKERNQQQEEAITPLYSFLISGIGLVTLVTAVQRIAYHAISYFQMYVQIKNTPLSNSLLKLNQVKTISFILASIFIGVIGLLLIYQGSALANLIQRIQIGHMNSKPDS